MSDISELTKQIVDFRDARDWKQFHNPKDMALSLVLEAAEVMEHFQYKNPKEIEEYLKTNRKDVGEELSDVLYWVLIMSHDLGIDLKSAFQKKLKKIGEKYPVEKARGSNKKYNQL